MDPYCGSLVDPCWIPIGSLLDSCGILVGPLLDPCWIPIGSLSDSYGILIGSLLIPCWILVGSLLDPYLDHSWITVGSLLDPYWIPIESPWRALGGSLGDSGGLLVHPKAQSDFYRFVQFFCSKPLVFVRDGEFDGENAMGF